MAGASHRIGQITQNTFDVKPGSVFPALHRMEEAVAHFRLGRFGEQSQGQVYRLTAAGRKQNQTETRQWETIFSRHCACAGSELTGAVMPLFDRLASLGRNLFARARVERELDAELRAYLDQLTDEKRAAGMDAGPARRAAGWSWAAWNR